MEKTIEHLGEIIGGYFNHVPDSEHIFMVIEQKDGSYKVFTTEGTKRFHYGENPECAEKDKIRKIGYVRIGQNVIRGDITNRFYPEQFDFLVEALKVESGDTTNLICVAYKGVEISPEKALELHHQSEIIEKLNKAEKKYLDG